MKWYCRLFSVTLITSVFISCNDKSLTPEPDPVPVIQKNYTIESSSTFQVYDSISGNTFRFPDGGKGVLSVATSNAGVELDTFESSFSLEYNGIGRIELCVQIADSGYAGLMVYERTEDVLFETAGEDSFWLPVHPRKIFGDTVVFSLFESPESYLEKKTTKKPLRGRFISFSHPQHSNKYKSYDYYSKAVKHVFDSILPMIPVPLRDSVDKRIKGDYSYTVSVYHWLSSLPGYREKYRSWWRDIMLLSNSDLSNVAHETGHYLHQVLCGFTAFKKFEADAIANHEIGMVKPSRKALIEEFAYFVEHLMHETIKSSTNPQNGGMLSHPTKNETLSFLRDPGIVDFPSIEGFPLMMFASVLRTGTTVKTFRKEEIELPVVHSVTAGDIFRWEAYGFDNVEIYRDSIENKLSASEKTLFPVILHSIGWVYKSSGVIVDEQKKGVANAIVYNLVQSGEKNYVVDSSNVSGTDGVFSIRWSFGGESIYRVKSSFDPVNKVYLDSIDFKKTIPWKTVTSTIANLDTFTIGVQKQVGKVRNVLMNIPGSEPMFGLDINAGITDDAALTSDIITLYVKADFVPSGTIKTVNTDIDLDYAVYVDAEKVKSGTVVLEPVSSRSRAQGDVDVVVGTLPLGKHTIKLILDPELKVTDLSLTDKDTYRIIEKVITVYSSYLAPE